jgi:hypothetical protein
LPVVAFFVRRTISVTANQGNAGRSWGAEPRIRVLLLAIFVASVPAVGICFGVVTLLGSFTDPISTNWSGHARLSRLDAVEPGLHHLAVGAAAIPIVGVVLTIVANFRPLDDSIAADDDPLTELPLVQAQVVGIDGFAVGATSVVAARVPVVAQLSHLEQGVAAFGGGHGIGICVVAARAVDYEIAVAVAVPITSGSPEVSIAVPCRGVWGEFRSALAAAECGQGGDEKSRD